jgi:hypothetical protein
MTTAAERKYEDLAERMADLKRQMLELATEVHQANAPGKKDDDAGDHVAGMATLVTNVKKLAIEVKRAAEANLDLLATSVQGPGETFAKAYSRAIETPMGRSLVATLDDAQALATGTPTAAMLDAHRQTL